MRLRHWLSQFSETKRYNPEDDPILKEREHIKDRTERVARLTDEFRDRVERGRFPILLDDPRERPRW